MDPEQAAQDAVTASFPINVPAPHPEHIQIIDPGPGSRESSSGNQHDSRNGGSPTEQPLINTGSDGQLSQSHENPLSDFERIPIPRAARSREGHKRLSSRRTTMALPHGFPGLNHDHNPHDPNALDWIVPVDEKSHIRKTLGERLLPTLETAIIERDKYAQKALWTGYALNIAIGLQVLLGALTTACAAAISTAKQAQVSTSILGGMSTLVASYLARARGSGEPELSITRVKDLEQFIRECRAFQMDHAHEYGTPESGLNEKLAAIRRRFEELLGNANGERRLSPVGITATNVMVPLPATNAVAPRPAMPADVP